MIERLENGDLQNIDLRLLIHYIIRVASGNLMIGGGPLYMDFDFDNPRARLLPHRDYFKCFVCYDMINSDFVSCNAIIPRRTPVHNTKTGKLEFKISAYTLIVNIDQYVKGMTHDKWYDMFPTERLEPFRYEKVQIMDPAEHNRTCCLDWIFNLERSFHSNNILDSKIRNHCLY